MSHWAQLDSDNKVIQVLVCNTNDPNGDEGYQFLLNAYGGTWVKTSYNAHINGFRKTFAGIGATYDEEMDAFIPQSPFKSWTFNKETFEWQAPVPRPEDETKFWLWDEENQTWNEVQVEEGADNDNS